MRYASRSRALDAGPQFLQEVHRLLYCNCAWPCSPALYIYIYIDQGYMSKLNYNISICGPYPRTPTPSQQPRPPTGSKSATSSLYSPHGYRPDIINALIFSRPIALILYYPDLAVSVLHKQRTCTTATAFVADRPPLPLIARGTKHATTANAVAVRVHVAGVTT